MLVAFDLDDTLFDEMDFVESAYLDIAERVDVCPIEIGGKAAAKALKDGGFDRLIEILGGELSAKRLELDIPCLINIYRNHIPETLPLREGALDFLVWLSQRTDCVLGLITDGRSRTQRAKIHALGIERFFPSENILISEETGNDKTTPFPFEEMMRRNPNHSIYVYVGDNTAKDFTHPGRLGWQTACMLSHGRNVHPQNVIMATSQTTLPPCDSFKSLRSYIENISEILRD